MLINYTSVLLLLAAASQPLEIKTVGSRMHAGIGEGLPELRGVDDITGPHSGSIFPTSCELGHVGSQDCETCPTVPCVQVTLHQVLNVLEPV